MRKKDKVTNPILVMSTWTTTELLTKLHSCEFDLKLRALLLQAEGDRKRIVI